ncbi:MAG: hypothetical protein AB8G05_19315 [Oligoflexales bacterium]
MNILLLVLCLSLAACGSSDTEEKQKTSDRNHQSSKTQDAGEENPKPNSPSNPIVLVGVYIHKEYKLAAPIYEFIDNGYKSIEIVGANRVCILTEVIEGEFDLFNSSTLLLKPSKSSNPERILKELTLDITKYVKARKPAIFEFLCRSGLER